jgi:hypothetical protein
MNKENKHTVRLALLLAFMVVMLFVVSVDQYRSVDAEDQQASVLRAYAE